MLTRKCFFRKAYHQHETSGQYLGSMLYMDRRKLGVFLLLCSQPFTMVFYRVTENYFQMWHVRSQAHSKRTTLVSVIGNANSKNPPLFFHLNFQVLNGNYAFRVIVGLKLRLKLCMCAMCIYAGEGDDYMDVSTFCMISYVNGLLGLFNWSL